MNQGSNDHDPNQANANAIIRIAALFSDWMWMRPAGHTTTITTITAAKIDATLRESVHRALFIGQTAWGLRPCVSEHSSATCGRTIAMSVGEFSVLASTQPVGSEGLEQTQTLSATGICGMPRQLSLTNTNVTTASRTLNQIHSG